eukprot:gnl/TRDRNA2_/TRDRNA2_148718_c1_seq2.p1 gnl/TRDRNA2_/TRDRNA2_148718_c1~~gnl/TRDRNA2_/TRDRNA2_148718_c1_seq2.p1  ORF type:complete len:555 (+),score=68.77 gnl/TRDRNA2_/TRDRNA2_148718_c1_seq2:96-1760(+)
MAGEVASTTSLSCFGDGFTFDLCCASAHGPGGNPECWDELYTFERCCVPVDMEYTNPTCWAEPAARLAAEGPQRVKSFLRDEESLVKFCCSMRHNEFCWGRGPDTFMQSDSDEPLGFTEQYIRCCFPQLHDLLAEGVIPAWMANGIREDLEPWQSQAGNLQTADLDAFEASLDAGNRSLFCRFRVDARGRISHCDFGESRYYVLLEALDTALHVLRSLAPLPQLDFFVNTDEAFCLEFGANPGKRPASHFNLPVPILAQAKPRTGCESALLMPWWAFLTLDWARRYAASVGMQSLEIPWESRVSKLFWRGSDTGCLLPGGCSRQVRGRRGGTGGCRCTPWNADTWPRFPRSKLVLLSGTYRAVDAKFTKDVVHADCAQVYNRSGFKINSIVPPRDHLIYKYLMYVDGTSFSDRLCWLLYSGAAVFRPLSPLRVWLDAGLQPYDHFVPVAEDLGDLVDAVEWARTNDLALETIAAQARQFALSELSVDASLYYLYRLLRAYAGLFERQGPKEHDIGDPECWESGLTSALCCDNLHGLNGHAACWNEDYTFERCCS